MERVVRSSIKVNPCSFILATHAESVPGEVFSQVSSGICTKSGRLAWHFSVLVELVSDLVTNFLHSPISQPLSQSTNVSILGAMNSFTESIAKIWEIVLSGGLGVQILAAFIALMTLSGIRRVFSFKIDSVKSGAPKVSVSFHTRELDALKRIHEQPNSGLQETPGVAPFTNKSSYALDHEVLRAVLEMLRKGNKIEAIKKIREATGSDLVTAKTTAEVLEQQFR